jgi:hypothetical protein
MPITPYLNAEQFEPLTKRVLGAAFEMARVALHLDRHDDSPLAMLPARKIIELSKGGENNPDLLCERALVAELGFRVARPYVTGIARRSK